MVHNAIICSYLYFYIHTEQTIRINECKNNIRFSFEFLSRLLKRIDVYFCGQTQVNTSERESIISKYGNAKSQGSCVNATIICVSQVF